MLLEQYAQQVTQTIEVILREEREKIVQAAQLVQTVLENDGLIYVFGCGHSHILCEELFYRAGGLANVAPILYPPLMLHQGAVESSRQEKLPGLAKKVLEQYPISPRDLLFCLSTSGINAVPVELAEAAGTAGVPVVAVCSSAYFDRPSGSPDGKHLYETGILWIDNKAPYGDACLQPDGAPIRTTPISTITGAFVLNGILAEGMQLAFSAGVDVPVYLSGNIPGGAERNRSLIERFQPRIRHL